jgi:hypothetical protein
MTNIFDNLDQAKKFIMSINDIDSASLFLNHFQEKYLNNKGFTDKFKVTGVNEDCIWYNYGDETGFETTIDEDSYIVVALKEKRYIEINSHTVFKLDFKTGKLIKGFLDDQGYKWIDEGCVWRE